MACSCAKRTDEYHGYECTITEGPCMFLIPNSKRCAEEYGEGPDSLTEEDKLYDEEFAEDPDEGMIEEDIEDLIDN